MTTQAITLEKEEILRSIDEHEPNEEMLDAMGETECDCPLCVCTPNAETLAALRDVEQGRVERFETKEALYKDLGLL